ncbi:MAG TPA: helix-turn-helix transcriptional regulator [Polynucleobacter sp.]|nr:helix-turn-helix transcriptional regulator [Polynucleobacter sp.]
MRYTSVHSPEMDLAKQIDQAMRDWKPKRLSQAELARLSGVPQPTISRTLKGDSIPETDTLLRISKVLRISFSGLDFKNTYPQITKNDEEKLLSDYRQLSDFNKGRLMEKADQLLMTQNKSKSKSNTNTLKAQKKAA